MSRTDSAVCGIALWLQYHQPTPDRAAALSAIAQPQIARSAVPRPEAISRPFRRVEQRELLPDPRRPLPLGVRAGGERVDVSVVGHEVRPQALRDVGELAVGELPEQLVVRVVGQRVFAPLGRLSRVEVGVDEIQVRRRSTRRAIAGSAPWCS